MSLEKASKPMQDLVAAVAGPRGWGETRESWLARAARNAGVTFRQAKSLFYGEPVSPDVARKMKLAAGRHEAGQLATRFEDLAVALNVRDEDFHRNDIAALLSAARALRNLGGS